MQLKQLFADEDAVSPVIGVILMVAITVILAAVIGTFVLGLGENVQDSAPQANFQFEYQGTFESAASADGDAIKVTHTGGEDVNADEITMQVGSTKQQDVSSTGDLISDSANTTDATVSTGSTFIADESAAVGGIAPNTDVRIIWTSPSGGTSNTIGQSTVPS